VELLINDQSTSDDTHVVVDALDPCGFLATQSYFEGLLFAETFFRILDKTPGLTILQRSRLIVANGREEPDRGERNKLASSKSCFTAQINHQAS
jgi:hypothetical protein